MTIWHKTPGDKQHTQETTKVMMIGSLKQTKPLSLARLDTFSISAASRHHPE